jgi:hypothetical protein
MMMGLNTNLHNNGQNLRSHSTDKQGQAFIAKLDSKVAQIHQ